MQQVDIVDMLDGMHAAEEAANRSEPCWSEMALDALLEAGRQLGDFTIEEARVICEVESPTDRRAWGGVVNRAAGRGMIIRTGDFRAARSSHGSPKPVWRVAV